MRHTTRALRPGPQHLVDCISYLAPELVCMLVLAVTVCVCRILLHYIDWINCNFALVPYHSIVYDVSSCEHFIGSWSSQFLCFSGTHGRPLFTSIHSSFHPVSVITYHCIAFPCLFA